jgi:hypothetical protein
MPGRRCCRTTSTTTTPTFTAPFSGELPFNRIDEMIHEYACHEGNYALPSILAGARAAERGQTEQKNP